jgi:GTPase SAR1 family protein
MVVCGAKQSGKTCIVMRWTTGKVPETVKPSVGCPLKSLVLHDGEERSCKISVYEIPKDKISLHGKTTMGMIFVYDVTNPESVEFMAEALDLFKNCRHREDCLIYVVGNKIDGDKQVAQEAVKELFAGVDASFFEISVKENLGTEDLFHHLETVVFP